MIRIGAVAGCVGIRRILRQLLLGRRWQGDTLQEAVDGS